MLEIVKECIFPDYLYISFLYVYNILEQILHKVYLLI